MNVEGMGTTVLKYFNPARSPFYPIVAFGGAALVVACTGISDRYWYFVAVPIYLCILVAISFSFAAAPGLSGQEQTEQIVFARSLSISAAALALATTATVTENVPEAFWTVFAVCVVQMIVFMLYIIVRWWAEDPFDRNYVQIALNTLSLLIEICRCLYSYSQALRPSEGSPKDLVTAHHYLFSAVAMIVLWTWCIGFWVKYFYKIAVRIPKPPAPSAGPA